MMYVEDDKMQNNAILTANRTWSSPSSSFVSLQLSHSFHNKSGILHHHKYNMSSSDNPKVQSIHSTSTGPIADVTLHPLVLLSVADHYHRVARGTRKRVVGVLLGEVVRGRVDVTNSFAVPFEEDAKVPAIYYLDHNYLENMLHMFRKVNSKERVVGFYSTGPEIRPNDMKIYELMKRFLPRGTTTPPVFVIIDIRPDRPSMPMTAYRVVEDVEEDSSAAASSSPVKRTFAHVPSVMGAMEAEEVGVEHLLRDINDPTISTVASLIRAKASGLQTLGNKLKEIQQYLQAVMDNKLKPNHEIMSNLQTILNLLPNLNNEDMIRSLIVKTNDMHLAIYLSSLIRSVTAMHDLINNKIRYNEAGESSLPESVKTADKKVSINPIAEEEKKTEEKDDEEMEK